MTLVQKNDSIVYKSPSGTELAAEVVVAAPGPNPPSGVAAASGTISAPGSTTALALLAGRGAYLYLSGGTSGTGYFEYSKGDGNWYGLYVEGSRLGTFSYAGANQVIAVPALEEAGIQVRATFSAASGTIAYSLEQ